MCQIDLVAFDIAGTTVVDTGHVGRTFRETLHAHGIDTTADEVQAWQGAAKRDVLRFFIERQYGVAAAHIDTHVAEVYADFRTRLEAGYTTSGVTPIDGTAATFAWLRERGIAIALTTGFYRAVTDSIVQALGWHSGVIDATVCSDDVAQGRPAPFMLFRAMEATGVIDVRRVVAVGDTPLDLQAGSNAEVCGVVGVLTGSHSADQLHPYPHTHLIASVADLPDLLQTEFGTKAER